MRLIIFLYKNFRVSFFFFLFYPFKKLSNAVQPFQRTMLKLLAMEVAKRMNLREILTPILIFESSNTTNHHRNRLKEDFFRGSFQRSLLRIILHYEIEAANPSRHFR